MQATAIVVPCYNEAARFKPEPFIECCQRQSALSLIFVDDGSVDATFELLSRTAARLPLQMSVLRLQRNGGKAEAVRHGVLEALRRPVELVGFWDADLATPLYNIQQFAEVLEQPSVQLVVGSRIRLLGRRIERDAFRHYTGRGFATVAALALRLPIYDTQCGAKVFRANPIFREIFSTPFELGWAFDVEVIARLARILLRNQLEPKDCIVEVPLREWVDTPGSKLRARHVPRIAWEVLRLFDVARR